MMDKPRRSSKWQTNKATSLSKSKQGSMQKEGGERIPLPNKLTLINQENSKLLQEENMKLMIEKRISSAGEISGISSQ